MKAILKRGTTTGFPCLDIVVQTRRTTSRLSVRTSSVSIFFQNHHHGSMKRKFHNKPTLRRLLGYSCNFIFILSKMIVK